MCFDETPVALEHIHLPVNMFNSMEFSKLEVSKYAYIEEVTGKKVQLRDQHLTAINLTQAETLALLKLGAGDAVIQINETVFLDDGVPCEVNVGWSSSCAKSAPPSRSTRINRRVSSWRLRSG